jgi:hypothetical protein
MGRDVASFIMGRAMLGNRDTESRSLQTCTLRGAACMHACNSHCGVQHACMQFTLRGAACMHACAVKFCHSSPCAAMSTIFLLWVGAGMMTVLVVYHPSSLYRETESCFLCWVQRGNGVVLCSVVCGAVWCCAVWCVVWCCGVKPCIF